jgi:putative ABC transport system substrate-binding protein
MKHIGIIVAGSAYPMEGFKLGLRDLGWVEGERIRFELRAAEGQLHLLSEFASEMVGLGVDLIAVIGAVTVRAVRQATSRIPIVFAVVVEPIGDGLATNLERPGGNITGVTTFDPLQAETQLEFLRAVNPSLERVAILSDLGVSDCMSNSNQDAARRLQLEPQVIRVEAPSPEYEKAFASMEREHAQALVVLEEPINQACRKQIADLAAARAISPPASIIDIGNTVGNWRMARVFGKRPGGWPATRTTSSEGPIRATYPLRLRSRTRSWSTCRPGRHKNNEAANLGGFRVTG